MEEEKEEHKLVPDDAQKTLEWITVLCAAGLDYRLSKENNAWVLHIPLPERKKAVTEIEQYERQNSNRSFMLPTKEEASPAEDYRMSYWLAFTLLAFFLRFGAFDASVPLLRAGCADGPAIMAGEWWRIVTALTLHSGAVHLLGNMIFIIIIGRFVCRIYGGGLGILVIIAGGALGNWLTAATLNTGYLSIGASTACFAALGILAVRQALQNYSYSRVLRSIWSPVWIPLCAAIAMLGIMGTGERSDLPAHAFGFLSGMLLAFPLKAIEVSGVPSKKIQLELIVLSALIIITAWIKAAASVR